MICWWLFLIKLEESAAVGTILKEATAAHRHSVKSWQVSLLIRS
jgi:hypothetical protein